MSEVICTGCNGKTNGTDRLNNELVEEIQNNFNKFCNTENFNRVAKNIKVLSATPNSLLVELTIDEQHVNNKGTLHGGQTAALVDIVTARAVGITVHDVPMVSVDISVSYMLPVKIGETITIEAICLKIGRNIAFTEAIFRRKIDNALVAKGRHNIALLNHLKGKNGETVNQF